MAQAGWSWHPPPQARLPERVAPEALIWMGAASLFRPWLLSHAVPLGVLAEAQFSPPRVSSCLLQRFRARQHRSSASGCSRGCSTTAGAYCAARGEAVTGSDRRTFDSHCTINLPFICPVWVLGGQISQPSLLWGQAELSPYSNLM